MSGLVLPPVAWERVTRTILAADAAALDVALPVSDYFYFRWTGRAHASTFLNPSLRFNADAAGIYHSVAAWAIHGGALGVLSNATAGAMTMARLLTSSQTCAYEIFVHAQPGARRMVKWISGSQETGLPTNLWLENGSGAWVNTVDEITEVRFFSNGIGGLGAGSIFEVYRGIL